MISSVYRREEVLGEGRSDLGDLRASTMIRIGELVVLLVAVLVVPVSGVSLGMAKGSRIPARSQSGNSIDDSDSVGCGLQATGYAPKLPSTKNRVINGIEAKPNSWPWAVIMERNNYIFCGATLIRVSDDVEASDIVLTAAHCVGIGKTDDPENYKGWTVTAGEHRRNVNERGQEKRNVIKAVYNENYQSVRNDIALVVLDRPIQFTDKIRPPCLPAQGAAAPIGQLCVVGGWGRNDSDNPYQPSDTLQQAVEPVHDSPKCKKPWGGTFQPDIMLCVGDLAGKSGTCNGDSGGMLVCRGTDGRWVQQGVMSFVGGKGRCVQEGMPSVFTRVSTYTDWIREKIQELSSLANKK